MWKGKLLDFSFLDFCLTIFFSTFESPNQVLERTTQLILDLDNQSKNSAIVLIAHGGKPIK
jgi:broad specificity phosphatase PhoE